MNDDDEAYGTDDADDDEAAAAFAEDSAEEEWHGHNADDVTSRYARYFKSAIKNGCGGIGTSSSSNGQQVSWRLLSSL